MQAKELKIYRGSGRNYTPVPQIIIQGKWLRSLGFFVGDKVTVTQDGAGSLLKSAKTGMMRRKRLPWWQNLPPDTERIVRRYGRWR